MLEIPFKPFSMPLFERIERDEKENNDAFKLFKTEYSQHDVVVTNIMDHVFIDFLHVDFIRDFYNKENQFSFPKLHEIIYPIKRVAFGGGVTFAEGQRWARKRKIFNRVFNFELIKSKIPKINQICDESFEKFDKLKGKK